MIGSKGPVRYANTLLSLQRSIRSRIGPAFRAVAPGPVAAILLSACSTTSTPTLRVAGANIREQSPEGLVIVFDIEARNKGKNPIPLRDARYRLESGDGLVINVRRAPGVTIPADDAILFTLPVPIPDGIAQGPITYQLVGKVAYSAPGPFAEALYDNGLSRPSTPFRDVGTIELRDPQSSEGG